MRIDGVGPGDLESAVGVVALTNALDGASPSRDGAGAVGLVGWVPPGGADLIATIIVDGSAGDTTAAGWRDSSASTGSGRWPIVTSFQAVPADGRRFAWGAELDVFDDQDVPERVATWTALIDAGARVLMTRHVAEAKRVATLISDLLVLQAAAQGN